jgi:hypothetical protein
MSCKAGNILASWKIINYCERSLNITSPALLLFPLTLYWWDQGWDTHTLTCKISFVCIYFQCIWATTGVKIAQSVNELWAGRLGFYSLQCKIFLFSTVSRPTLGPTQPPIQWVWWSLSLGIKRQGREADHSPPSSAEVKKGGATLPLPHMSSWHSA